MAYLDIPSRSFEFPSQLEALTEFSATYDLVIPRDWEYCPDNVIPACLSAGKKVPASYNYPHGWQTWFLEGVIKKSEADQLTLPWLYLFTFHHFLLAIHQLNNAENQQYSPSFYHEVLFRLTPEFDPFSGQGHSSVGQQLL